MAKYFHMYMQGSASSNMSSRRSKEVNRNLSAVESPSLSSRRKSEQVYVPAVWHMGRVESLAEAGCRTVCDDVVDCISHGDATHVHVVLTVETDRRFVGACQTVHLLERNLHSIEQDFRKRGCAVTHTVRVADNERGSFVNGLRITAELP